MTNLYKKEPKREELFPIPLIDRLINLDIENDTESSCFRYYTLEETIDSIRQNVEALLSTRNGMRKAEYLEFIQNIDNAGYPSLYGVPDYQENDPSDKANWLEIEKIYTHAIRVYEPRLIDIQVSVLEYDSKWQRLSIAIKGSLHTRLAQREVTFPLLLGPKT